MLHDNMNHHGSANLIISENPLVRGAGFRHTNLWEKMAEDKPRLTNTIEKDGQLLFDGGPHMSWEDLVKTRDRLFPNAHAIQENRGVLVRSTYVESTPKPKPCSKKKKASKKIRWP